MRELLVGPVASGPSAFRCWRKVGFLAVWIVGLGRSVDSGTRVLGIAQDIVEELLHIGPVAAKLYLLYEVVLCAQDGRSCPRHL